MTDRIFLGGPPRHVSPDERRRLRRKAADMLPREQLARLSIEFAVGIIGNYVFDGEIYLIWLDAEGTKAAQQLKPVYQSEQFDQLGEIVGYRASDISEDQWIDLFNSGGHAHRYIRRFLAKNVHNGFPMPDGARRFAARLTAGYSDPPVPQRKPTLVHRDTLLAIVANRVRDEFGLEVGAAREKLNGEPKPLCASVIAAAGLHGFGMSVAPKRAADIASKKRNKARELEDQHAFAPPTNLVKRPLNNLAVGSSLPDVDVSSLYADEMERALHWFGK